MSPQTIHAGRHIRTWSGMGTLVFSALHCRDFSFFYFLFFACTKNANKRISYFFLLRCFLRTFFIYVRLFALCVFVLFRASLWVRNLFVKNTNKKFKSALITLFILLLTLWKKRLWPGCFPVNFAKFLRRPFLTERFWWLLLLSIRSYTKCKMTFAFGI